MSSSVEWLFSNFERHFRRVKKVQADLLQSGGLLQLQVQFAENKLSTDLSLDEESHWVRFAVVMRRFLDPSSELYFYKIYERIGTEYGNALEPEFFDQFEQHYAQVTRGAIALQVDEDVLRADEVYQLVAEGDFFRTETSARHRLHSYTQIPIGKSLFWYLFYSFHIEAYRLVSILRHVIRRIQQTDEFWEKHGVNQLVQQRCIYCLTTEGSFRSEEHIVSEVLGNYDLVLPRGYVCDRCNHGVLSGLDNELANWGPLAYLRVLFVPYNKTGNPPSANFQNLSIEKPRPGHLVVNPKDRTGEIKITERLPDGSVRFNINTRSKWVDPKLIGRALYKIALGFFALDHGIEKACESQFDAARQFILGQKDFPNNLLMSTRIVPHSSFHLTYYDLTEGTPYWIDFYGLVSILNLETSPLLKLPDELAQYEFELHSLHE